MVEKKRIDSFDILKAIAIFLVVFCHYVVLSDTIAENFVMTLCFIGVPIFFMVNGALLMRKSFNLKQHLIKTFSVYTIATIWRVLYLIINVIKNDAFEQLINLKQETLSHIFLWSSSSLSSPGHMWFMESLIAIYLIFPLLHICYKSERQGRQGLYLVLAVLFVGIICKMEFNIAISIINKIFSTNLIISANPITDFLPYSQGVAIFYFVLGAMLTQKLNGYENFPKINISVKQRIFWVLTFIASWILMIWTKSLIDGTWIWNGTLYAYGYQRIPTLLASVSLFIALYDITLKTTTVRKFFKTISSYTLGIYYLHWVVLPFITPLFDTKGLLENTLKTLLAISISCFIIFILDYIPIIRKMVK